MRTHQPLTALALVFALAFALMLPGQAAATPKLTYTQSGNTAKLTLQELGNDSIYGVQLELTFVGQYESAAFTPNASTAYAPPCHRATAEDVTQVTIYLTDHSPLNKDGSLTMGSLTLPGSFTMPEAATVTLLDRDLKPVTNARAIAVSRQSTSSGSSGSSGGGSRPTPAPTPTPTPTPTPEPTPATGMPFTDVKESDWYFNEVKYVYSQGMMNGTAETTFAPSAATSRAMLVTILYRLADTPPTLPSTFSDVAAHQYYTDAVGWASAQSIVTGYEDGLFRPNDLLTREQLATILYRYSLAMGYNTTSRGNLSGFSDTDSISAYAREPMAWAVASGLLSGMGNGAIDPAGQATRAQVATILARFCKNVANPPRGV